MQFNSTSLLDQVRDLNPNLKFCGEPKNAILSVSDDLICYVLSILRNDPIVPPRMSITKWLELLHILKAHWVLPLLYWHIGRLPDEFRPPEPIFDNMRTVFQWSRARCFHLERQLQEIVAAFDDEGVRVVVLKGPALGRTAYPDPALRPSSDLDLLVLPDQMSRSRTTLEGLGYKCIERRFEISRDFYNDELFVHQKNERDKPQVELHWDLHRFSGIRRDVGVEELFERAVKVRHKAFAFEALDPIDAFMHRAMSNAFDKATNMRLIWVYDVASLARHLVEPDDWEILQKRSVDWRARLAVEQSLRMAQALLGFVLPQGFRDFSAWQKPTDIELEAWPRVSRGHVNLIDHLKLCMSHSTGPYKKVRYFANLLFPSRDYMIKSYMARDRRQLYLSYARRWWKWAKEL